jgi:hypothetical protein
MIAEKEGEKLRVDKYCCGAVAVYLRFVESENLVIAWFACNNKRCDGSRIKPSWADEDGTWYLKFEEPLSFRQALKFLEIILGGRWWPE